MVKVMYCGASCCVVLSCMARLGVILALLGFVRSCPARLRPVRQGISLRGLALYRTVLSCPVRLCKVFFCKLLLWYGGAVSGPAGSSGAWLCKVRRLMVRSGCAGRAIVGRGFVLQGEVLLWFGEVLIGIVGWIGALYSRVRSYCGIVWVGEALHVVVKLGPVKYCYVMHAKALLRRGTVGSCLARLRAVWQALKLLRSGQARRSPARFCSVRFSKVYGHVR